MKQLNHATDPEVPPDVVAWVERILEERNVGGMVPADIYFRILDDMADITDRTADWSCDSMRRYGIHVACQQPIHKTRKRGRAA